MGRHWLLGALLASLGCAMIAACSDDPVPEAVVGMSSSATSSATSTGSGHGGMGGSAGGCDGGMGGGTGEPEWCCLGAVDNPAPTAPTLDLGVQAIAFATDSLLAGLTVKACAFADTACADPVDEGVTDVEGKLVLTVPTGTEGFDGFFDVTGAAIRPAMVFPFPPLVEAAADVQVQLVTTFIYALLQTSVGFTPDPARGDMVVLATDCNRKQAPGVRVTASTADAQSSAVYVVDRAPSDTATETDVSGVAGWFNLPPGPVEISASRASDGARIGSIQVFVRPGTITYTTIPPTD